MTTATTPSHQTATWEDLTPRAITVIAWPDPVIDSAAGSIPTASDDALICSSGGHRQSGQPQP